MASTTCTCTLRTVCAAHLRAMDKAARVEREVDRRLEATRYERRYGKSSRY